MKLIIGFFILSTLNLFISINLYGNEIKEGVLRTPDERFENLKDYPFKPNYMMIDGLRIHYLDEGPRDADPIFLLHGEPAWSYLFRKMIPLLTTQGHRVIVPDCVGFGKSDKFLSKYDYSYKHHVDVMKELVQRLDLKNTTFFGQDWGGLVGLRVVGELPDRFSHVVVSNTGLVARSGVTAWLFEKFVQFRVWWIGPITFEELMDKAKEALTVENPSPTTGISMFSNWICLLYTSPSPRDISGSRMPSSA